MTAAPRGPDQPTPADGELVALHASLTVLRPSLTWQPTDWLAATGELRPQLAHLPGLLRALRAHPALDLAEHALTDWPLDVDAAIEQLRDSALPAFAAWLVQLLDPRTPPPDFAGLTGRFHLVHDQLLDAVTRLLELLDQQPGRLPHLNAANTTTGGGSP